jgi:tetratricopeptide (TPR) repeat protein
MVFAVRTVFGTENRIAAGVVSLSWIPLLATLFLWGPFSLILRWLTSPFLLFFVFYYLRGEFANLGAGLRSQQHFHRMLEAAAVNPHDGDAQYQLGLIYQQRRQYTEAIRRLNSAVAIDSGQTDAHFQLGRIAIQQGRLCDALEHLQTVFVSQLERDSARTGSIVRHGRAVP